MANQVSEWTKISDALPEVGVIVNLRFWDPFGVYGSPAERYFRHDDGQFYKIDPPRLVEAKVHAWRVAK